jgi:hypothetical protein
MEDEAEASSRLESAADQIDEQLLSTLMSAAQRMEQGGQTDRAEVYRRLHRHALRLAMRAKMGNRGSARM